MDFLAIHYRVFENCGRWIVGCNSEAIDPWIEVRAQGLCQVGQFLRDDPQLQMNMLHCITAVDYFEPNEQRAARVDWQPHLEVVYHVSSIVHGHRLVLKVSLPRWKDDMEGRLPEVPSVSRLWSTAIWHEREVFDLMGVGFTGHPDLRRILCPEDWKGHPLRKDYRLPDEYHGIPAR